VKGDNIYMFSQLRTWLKTHVRLDPAATRRPHEVWDGHAVYSTIDYSSDGARPWSVTVEIEVVAPASLLVRRRSIFRWTRHQLPQIDLPKVDSRLEVRGDDPAFARELFDGRAAALTLPLALKKGEYIEVVPNMVRVCRRAIDEATADAFGAARSMAMAVVSTLKLPPPSISASSD
jgi:hypothetical protein